MEVLAIYLVLFLVVLCFGTSFPWAVGRFIGYWGFRMRGRSDAELKYIMMRGQEEGDADTPLSDVALFEALEEEAKAEPWKTNAAVADRMERFKDGVIWR